MFKRILAMLYLIVFVLSCAGIVVVSLLKVSTRDDTLVLLCVVVAVLVALWSMRQLERR